MGKGIASLQIDFENAGLILLGFSIIF